MKTHHIKKLGVTAKSVFIGKSVSFNPYIMKEEMSEVKVWPLDQQHQHHLGTQICKSSNPTEWETGGVSPSQPPVAFQVIDRHSTFEKCWCTGWGKGRFTVLKTWNRVYSYMLTNYSIILHGNNCNPTFATPCILFEWHIYC